MKNLKLWLCLGLICICLGSIKLFIISNNNLYTEGEEENESGADKQLAMWFHARAYPNPYYLNDKYENAWHQATAIKNKNNILSRIAGSAQWTSLGSVANIGGRILSIAIDPNNTNNLFIGSASGGIWKSTNAGSTWSSVTTNLPVLGVASIVYHPVNSNIILAGTGEVYRSGISNIGFNVWKARGTYGIGILRSSDGGITWKQVFNKKTSDMFAIQMIKFDPVNNNIVYACATDGLYKSTDGGNTWGATPLISKTYVSDVAISPIDNQQIVIGVGNLDDADKGIYRTTDGGVNWTKLTTTNGLPGTFKGYIRFDNVGTNLFASIGGTTNELYICTTGATNFGETWIAKTGSAHCGGQYWFGHDLAINPTKVTEVIIGGVNYSKYTSSSATTSSGSKVAFAGSVHADVHDIKYVNNTTIYIACDGGMYKTTDGATFLPINTGLWATQFYASIAPSPTDSKIIIGGLQDNGVVKFNGTSWSAIAGGDGGPCAFNAAGNVAVYSNDARAVYYDNGTQSQPMKNLGYGYASPYDDRTAFMSPLAISKSNSNYVYVASDNLHISTDGGKTFSRVDPASTSTTLGMTRPIEQKYKTAIALAVSPTNPNKVYVSTSPFSQRADDALNINGQPNILKSLNASDNTNYVFSSIKALSSNSLPDRFIMDFAIDPTNDDIVFVTLGGFGTSHIYMTSDGGTNWTSIGSSGALPDVPFNAVLVDPVNPQTLYVGTDLGVYVSPDRGANWYDFNTGLSDATLVMDIQASADNQLILATHGKGIYKSPRFVTVLPLRFTSFDGKHENGQNKLTWNTADEINTKQYEIERSTDGLNFTRIGNVMAKNQTSSQNYQYTDILPAVAPVKLFYRIKCVDFNGAYTYTKVITLQGVTNNTFAVLQNPFKEKISVSVGMDRQQPIALRLYDNKGRLMKQLIYAGAKGINTIELNDVYYLPPGMYILESVFGNERKTSKLIRQ